MMLGQRDWSATRCGDSQDRGSHPLGLVPSGTPAATFALAQAKHFRTGRGLGLLRWPRSLHLHR
jgi:hypothetical protein